MKRQAEREIKGKLMWLRRGYVSAAGDAQFMAANIVRQFTGYVPLLRALIFLRGQAPPVAVSEVVARLSWLTGAEAQVFSEIFALKRKASQPSKEELTGLFARFYRTTERLLEIVDGLKAP